MCALNGPHIGVLAKQINHYLDPHQYFRETSVFGLIQEHKDWVLYSNLYLRGIVWPCLKVHKPVQALQTEEGIQYHDVVGGYKAGRVPVACEEESAAVVHTQY